MSKLPPICAMFLTQFDVHTGYELKWFKSLNDNIYSPKDLEFKSIPSGLHAVSSDTVCFIQSKNSIETNDFLYGISVFRQNNHLQQIDSNGDIDRSKVKMFSLGILLDPKHLETLNGHKDWQPKIYSVAWNYKSLLVQQMNNFINLKTNEQEIDHLKIFDAFFNTHSFKLEHSNTKQEYSLKPTLSTTSLKPTISTNSLRPTLSAASSILEDLDIKSDDHMINSLESLFEIFGPLVFKLWKISLLRKAVILYSPHNPASKSIIDTSDLHHEEMEHLNFKISDMSKILYCISLISSIPIEIQSNLENSINNKRLPVQENNDIGNALFYNKPIYNVCINDIGEMVKLNSNYLASTTDQIIIEKNKLYDYSIKLPVINKFNQFIAYPEVSNKLKNKVEYATSKDFERFKIIYSKLALGNKMKDNIIKLSNNVSETRSVQELIWNGLSWWATAGESYKSINEQFSIEFEFFDNLNFNDNNEKIITIIGYFQSLTIQIFSVLIELIDKSNNEELVLDANDLTEMGLDPYSLSDHSFVIELVRIYWNRNIKIGSYFNDLCYWN